MNARPHTRFCVPIFVRTRVSMLAHINTSDKRRNQKHVCLKCCSFYVEKHYENEPFISPKWVRNDSLQGEVSFPGFLVPGLL